MLRRFGIGRRDGGIDPIARLHQHMRRDEQSRGLNAAAGLTIRLFGGMAMRDSRGVDYLPRSRKTRAIVALLALTAPRPTERTQITSLLWSQRENEQARASLRQAVHELQRTLGPTWKGILLAERRTLSMNLGGVVVDALAASHSTAPNTELLALFQDGFLEDLRGLDPSFDAWLATERLRLVAIARMATEAYFQDFHEAQETVAAARALLRIDPAHDGAWRRLIEAHIEANDRSAARVACAQWRERLGTSPAPEVLAELSGFQSRIRLGAALYPEPGTLDAAVLDLPPPWMPTPTEEFSFGTTEEPSGPGPRHARLRLGIREMRVIGPNVDHALSVGLAEEITTALSRFRGISCVSGSSLAAIAAETGQPGQRWPEPDLDLALDGTIQQGGDRIRITVRLLDMRAGEAVFWANRFEHAAADALTVQDGVAASIVAQLDPVLLMREGERAAGRTVRGASARDLVLRAVPAIYRMDRTSFRAAGDLLEAALRVDPTYPDALAWFAYWHLFLVGQGWADDPEAATNRAGVLADTAVAMDPNDPRALTLAGHVRGFLLRRPSEAIVLHDRAISLNPNLAIAWCFSGFAHSYLGDQRMALERMRQAIQLSPSDPHLFFFQSAIIMPHLLRGEYQEAAEAGRKAIELNPWFSSSFKGQLATLGHLGHRHQAAAVMSRLLKLEPGFTVGDAIRRSPIGTPEDIERYAEGLRRAGLPE